MVNFNDGFGGGHDLGHNLIFNSCRESSDHGAFNSWDRQPYLTDVPTGMPSSEPLYSRLHNNFIVANYAANGGCYDNDDGSSWYDIHHNVIYGEGLKQDYGGHDSMYRSNLNLVHQYDGQNCINTWPFKTGRGPCGNWSTGEAECSHAHRFEQNRCVVLYTDVYSPGAGGCPPDFTEMAYLANNQYYTPTAGNATMKGCGTLAKLQQGGAEKGSTSSGLPEDPVWLGWAQETLGWR